MSNTTYATLADLKTHAGIPATGADTLLQAYLNAAAAWIDNHTNSTFIAGTATAEAYDGNGGKHILLRHRPVLAVSAVAIDGESLDSTLYGLTDSCWLGLQDYNRGRASSSLGLVLNEGEWNYNPRIAPDGGFGGAVDPFWPRGIGNITVDYTYGYSTVPPAVSTACAMLAAYWYSRDASLGVQSISHGPTSVTYAAAESAIPMGVRAMLAGYIQPEVGY